MYGFALAAGRKLQNDARARLRDILGNMKYMDNIKLHSLRFTSTQTIWVC